MPQGATVLGHPSSPASACCARPRNTTATHRHPWRGAVEGMCVWGRHVGKPLRPAPSYPCTSTPYRAGTHGTWGPRRAAGKAPERNSAAGPCEPAPPAGGAQIPDRRKQGLTSPPADTSGLYQPNSTHTIAFPVSSAGGEAQAMRGHRQAFPTPGGPPGGVPPTPYAGGAPATPEGTGKATRRAALRGSRTSSCAACDAPASRRDALLAGNLATPSYECYLVDKGH